MLTISGAQTMNNIELEILELQGAKFVELVPNQKRPRGKNWQQHSRRVQDLTHAQVGLLLGELGQGIGALDFDGTSAVDYFTRELELTVPKTVMWSSGKPGRFQMAVRVPQELTSEITGTFAVSTALGEQLEWRYARGSAGCQSVIPPSKHPELGSDYFYVPGLSPRDVEIAELSGDLLAWILSYRRAEPVSAAREYTEDNLAEKSDYSGEAAALHKILALIGGMRDGDRSRRACQVGGLMRYIRPALRQDILDRLKSAGCDRAALRSAIKYSRG